MEKEKQGFTCSDIVIKNRNDINVCGVDEVISYDDTSIILVVCGARTTVEGEGLRITKLDLSSGEIGAKGKINAIFCEEDLSENKGILRRMFGN